MNYDANNRNTDKTSKNQALKMGLFTYLNLICFEGGKIDYLENWYL